MGEIKSAFELAMEKVNKLGEVTEEERLRWKYVPEGEKLVLRYLNEGANLIDELSSYEEKARRYVTKGIEGILLSNINLPQNDDAIKNSKKAMDGLKLIKGNKEAVENIFNRIDNIFNHYIEHGEQQRRQAYESLKAELGARLEQAATKQFGSAKAEPVNGESHPLFQTEWRQTLARLDLQYTSHLDEYKKELASID